MVPPSPSLEGSPKQGCKSAVETGNQPHKRLLLMLQYKLPTLVTFFSDRFTMHPDSLWSLFFFLGPLISPSHTRSRQRTGLYLFHNSHGVQAAFQPKKAVQGSTRSRKGGGKHSAQNRLFKKKKLLSSLKGNFIF